MTQAIGFYGTDGFGYDAVGNLLTRSRVSGGTTTSVSYSYNSATNQLSKAAQTGGSTLSYSYDAAGSLIARKLGKTTQLALSYNADGRPAGAASEGYNYDGFGERVSIGMGGCLGICGGSVFSSFIFGRGGELLAENNGSGQPVRSYVYLNGLPLALVDGAGNIDYILADQVGQPQKMVDGSAALVWDRVPDVFGATVAQPVGMSTANPLRFPGQEYDAATGLHYNHFRDYDPALGRYVQSDPIGLNGGVNTYAYALENPVDFDDPSGLATLVIVGGPTSANPFGHVSIATTGSGVYSFGTLTPFDSNTPTPLGSSVTAFLADQARYRDVWAYVINTTPAQEAKILAYLKTQPDKLPPVPGPDSSDNCASRSNEALRKAGLYDPSNPLSLFFGSPFPDSSMMIGSYNSNLTNGMTVYISKGSTYIPVIFNQFNPG